MAEPRNWFGDSWNGDLATEHCANCEVYLGAEQPPPIPKPRNNLGPYCEACYLRLSTPKEYMWSLSCETLILSPLDTQRASDGRGDQADELPGL